MRRFNTAGKCIPALHYMVDISRQVETAARLVRSGDYFCINRGRQFGKTTTLSFIQRQMEREGYAVFSLSFEGLDDSTFASVQKLAHYTLLLMADALEFDEVRNLSEKSRDILASVPEEDKSLSIRQYGLIVARMCGNDKIVLLIDEVDQAGNHPEFIQFLGVLREMFLKRDVRPTFRSVVLAGVYDVKNLKLKIRPEDRQQRNSPWNIAVNYGEEMNLPADGIAGMLRDYQAEHGIGFDGTLVSRMIYDYTSGYPFLVSRICQIIDTDGYSWDKEGVLKAVNQLLKESNTLFDDMEKKISDSHSLAATLSSIVFCGKRVAFNYYDRDTSIALMFNFVKEKNGATVIYCRIFETWLYNLFISNEKSSDIFQNGQMDRNQFVHDGIIDIRHLLQRFCVHFNEIYRPGHDEAFVEDNGRKIFLTYLRPVINGIGNYYCEAQTRDLTRTDVIIDYLGNQYIIELKI